MIFKKISFWIGFIAVILSLIPFYINITIPVLPGRINPYWDNWPYDFNYYRSIITQGKNDRITSIDKYTSEPQTGKFLRSSYIVLGHLSNFLHIDETSIYHLTRIILGIFFVLLIYLLIKQSIHKHIFLIPLIFFMCLFTAGYPDLQCQANNCHLVPRLWSMTQLDPIRRITFIPHFLWGQIAFLLMIISFVTLSLKSWKKLLIVTIILGIAGLDHPPSLLLIFPVIGISLLSITWKNQLTKSVINKIIIMFFSALPLVIYIIYATASFPWNLTRNAQYPLGTNYIYLFLALGPTAIIGFFTAIYVLFSRKNHHLLIIVSAGWLTAIILLTFVFDNLKIYSQSRFLQVAPHIPSAILTGYVLSIIYEKLIQKFILKPIIFNILVIIIIFLPTIPTLFLLYYDQIDYVLYFAKTKLSTIPYPPIIDYPPSDWIKGFQWLKLHTQPNDVVLSDFTAGNFIPTYGGNTVYLGHETETYNYNLKKQLMINFFTSKSQKNQLKFLNDNQIKYIFYGPQEKLYTNSPLNITQLDSVYQNPLVTIYKVL